MKVCKHSFKIHTNRAQFFVRNRLVLVMKLKIVIEVPMSKEKCKSKAMRTAASTDGVISVSIESEANKMVVMGDGVDPVKLTASLRKKFDYANILIVEEVKPPPAEAPSVLPDPIIEWHPHYNGYPQHYIFYDVPPCYCPRLW